MSEAPYKCCGEPFNSGHGPTCPIITAKLKVGTPSDEFIAKAFWKLDNCQAHSTEECHAYNRLLNLAIEMQAGIVWDDPRLEDPIFTFERDNNCTFEKSR